MKESTKSESGIYDFKELKEILKTSRSLGLDKRKNGILVYDYYSTGFTLFLLLEPHLIDGSPELIPNIQIKNIKSYENAIRDFFDIYGYENGLEISKVKPAIVEAIYESNYFGLVYRLVKKGEIFLK